MATCCAAIFTLGIHPIMRWVWTAEETYARGDPRRILVNVHTERFKKVALLVGGAFAIAEAASLASAPELFYCAPRCSEVACGDDSDLCISQNPVFRCAEAPDGLSTSVSPPPVASPPPASPSLIGNEVFNAAASTVTEQLRVKLMTVRISINATAKQDILDKYWECQDGSVTPGDTDGFWADLRSAIPFITIRGIITTFMIATVLMWFVLRAALFNVLKGNKLCNCVLHAAARTLH